jgi:hypothetical protein
MTSNPSELEPDATTDGPPPMPSQERPEDPADPALQPETLGIDDTDTALATEDASDPAE